MGNTQSRRLGPSKLPSVNESTNYECASSSSVTLSASKTLAVDPEKPRSTIGDSNQDLSSSLPTPSTSTLCVKADSEEENAAYASFLLEYPEYALTSSLDTLRRTDFSRLDQTDDIYVDYMGGALYPESLVKTHAEFLTSSVLGNTHSKSHSAKLSVQYADEARAAVLAHFQADPAKYSVIFTSNATGALKLVAESFPFTENSKLIIGVDSHNSVHGIREYAASKGASTVYVPSTPQGGVDIDTAKKILCKNSPRRTGSRSLYVLTAQSNITNSKTPIFLASYATSLGYCTVMDAAAMAATSAIKLSEQNVDAMAVSFYKIFGYPTGVGALVAKKSFLSQLKRPWFAGGTVDIVQVPGRIFTWAGVPHEQFEDGTISYVQLAAITNGLRFARAYLPLLPLRLSSLTMYLASSLRRIRHDSSGLPVVHVLSRVPSQSVRSVGEQSDAGSVLSLVFFNATGTLLPNSFVEFAASKHGISLRTGSMCNTGGAAALLGMEEDIQNLRPGVTVAEYEQQLGREFGVVRISLGLASNFHDVWRVMVFATAIGEEGWREDMWRQWVKPNRGFG